MRALRALVAVSAAGCAAAAHLRRPDAGHGASPPEKPKSDADLFQVVVSAEAERVAKQLIAEQVGVEEAIKDVRDKMSVEEAIRRLNGKLSEDVTSLLKAEGKAEDIAAPKFSEKSLAKARVILNKMVFDSFAELDNVIVECKAFENMNRVSFGQVTTDLNRLGSEMAETEEKIAEAQNCMADQDKAHKKVSETIANERSSYEAVRAQDNAELTVKKNDLAVFNFIMKITMCKKKAALIQEPAEAVRVCSTDAGYELDFEDPAVRAKVGQMMTTGAKEALDSALGLAFASKIQEAQDSEATTTVATTTIQQKVTPKPTRVQESPPKSVAWKKCVDGKPNCGLLHDTMSLQWGKFKDLVDELQAEMDKKKDAWQALSEDLNEQLDVIATRKGECQTAFSAAVGQKNMIQTESDEKTTQMRELTVDYEKHMAVCKARIEELLFTDVCAVRKVRNEVLKSSKVSPPSKISDCEVSDWVAEECSVRCDNTCPHRVGGRIDPFACGGNKMLRRTIVVKANQFGIACPALKKQTRCGQYKCPVDCVMSKWSGWSKCTKDCGGGARQKTRSILVKPNHGGKFCDAPVETEACNTGSCDRNCKLDRWSRWTPCSMACNPGKMPGFQEKTKKVLVPIRGNGVCPRKSSAARYRKRFCNQQPCYGDEICIARQDLIIALDASGSLRESGFKVMRDFAANLTGSYRSEYAGRDQARLGVILFGNGVLADDGTTSSAINVIGLTADLKKVKGAILKTKWQRGYTNMAQAFILAETMFQQGGRSGAQSAVLVLSDGKYSFAFQTEQAVKKLKDKGTMIYFAPVASRAGDWQHKLKQWASQPWETNYEFVPGLQTLKNGMAQYSATLVAKFCPRAMSPTLNMHRADRRGYLVIREMAWPGRKCLKNKQQYSFRWIRGGARGCYRRVRQKFPKWNGMMVTRGPMRIRGRSYCWAQNTEITPALWKKLLVDRGAFQCKAGRFHISPGLNTYALKPTA